MHFFRAREAAEAWAEGRSGIAILSIGEADELAQTYVERTRAAAERADGRLGPQETPTEGGDEPGG